MATTNPTGCLDGATVTIDGYMRLAEEHRAVSKFDARSPLLRSGSLYVRRAASTLVRPLP